MLKLMPPPPSLQSSTQSPVNLQGGGGGGETRMLLNKGSLENTIDELIFFLNSKKKIFVDFYCKIEIL